MSIRATRNVVLTSYTGRYPESKSSPWEHEPDQLHRSRWGPRLTECRAIAVNENKSEVHVGPFCRLLVKWGIFKLYNLNCYNHVNLSVNYIEKKL